MSSHSLAMCCSAKQRDDLLAFALVLMRNWLRLPNGLIPRSSSFGLSTAEETHLDCLLDRWNQLHHQLSGKFHLVLEAVKEQCNKYPEFISGESQLVYVLLLSASAAGPQYLALLRFFLNHRTFMRSECPERVGKSPTQLMTGQPHPHWLAF